MAAQEPILDQSPPDSFKPPTEECDVEKINFPSYTQVIPTFSVAFGSGGDVPPPSQMFVGHQGGPRLYRGSAEPFECHMDGVVDAPPTYARSSSSNSHNLEYGLPQVYLARHDSCSSGGSNSQKTVERNNSQLSQSSSIRSKRWVIE